MVDGQVINAAQITPALLSDELQEAGGVEANVATGYHAIEFLLWGQDLNGNGAGAGERMKLGLLLGDPEEEHDCFADNTHNSHFYDAVGIQNVYTGRYTRIDGSVMRGPSLSTLVARQDAMVDRELTADLQATVDAMQAMVDRAETTEAYDQMIATNNPEGNAVVQAAIDALVDQTQYIERAIAALDLGSIELEGSDSLDNPGAVFQ